MDPNVLHNISYGMYIVASNKGDLLNGQIVNAVIQVTNVPVTIAVSINRHNLTYEYIESSKLFSVSILGEETPLSFIGKFGFKSGRTEEKFKNINYKMLESGCPAVIDNSIGYIEARVVSRMDFGTHTLFLGEMMGSAILKTGKPMTYDYYHQIKRGTTPESAPTFIQGEVARRGDVQPEKYKCVVCNYVYDPIAGDPDSGVLPGTAFEKLPADWVCPVCGADKSQFEREVCAV